MVTTLLERDLEGLRAAVAQLEAPTDAFEIRLDAVDRPIPPRSLRQLTRKPLVATNRRPQDGGTYEGPEEARLAQLEEAHEAGFNYVDLEAGVNLAIPEEHLIRSVHDFQATPKAEEIVRRGRTLARNGACFKFASLVRTLPDTLELLKAARKLRAEGLRCAIMGLGPFPRALAVLVGNEFVYAGGRTPAPHQPRLEELQRVLDHWGRPAPEEQLFLVVGSPIHHSLSPRLHNAAFSANGLPAAYGALEVATRKELEAVIDAASELNLLGLSVTMPLKEHAFELSPARTPEAERARAANCLKLDGRTVRAHNTDGLGATRVLASLTQGLARPRVLLFGTGGAARGILSQVRTADFTIAGRTPEKREALAREFGVPGVPLEVGRETMRSFDVVVNATGSDEPVTIRGYAGRVFDLQYGDAPTAWEAQARAERLPFAGGRDLLLHQGLLAYEFWTGQAAPAPAMAAALGVTP